MVFHSLKTRTVVDFALLFLLAMVSVDVVWVRIAEHHLIRARAEQARLSLSALMGRMDHPAGRGLEGFPGFVMLDVHDPSNTEHMSGRIKEDIGINIREITLNVEKTGKPQVRYAGNTWGVFWKQKRYMILSDPLVDSAGMKGAATLVVDLKDIYQTLRGAQKTVALYLAINLVIILLLGFYRISRMIFRPIQRMIKITEGYSGVQPLYFYPQKRHHEFNRLSNALNRMIQQIEADRERLKSSLESLQAANTELQKAQNDMIRAEKLASVGRLSAGIAHEIGNPIGVVLGYLGLLRKTSIAANDTAGRDYIDRAEAEINRIHRVIRQLLDFSRTQPVRPVLLSAHEVIQEAMESMAHHPIMADIRITSRLFASQDRIYGDAQQLRQVLLNLMINAADAIAAAGGSSRREIRLITDDKEEHGQAVFKLIVADDGIGIAKEDIDNIFDPFYTTKEPGKGTGLGLSASHAIIAQMGGGISVESEPGRGTAVVITLPLQKKEQSFASKQ